METLAAFSGRHARFFLNHLEHRVSGVEAASLVLMVSALSSFLLMRAPRSCHPGQGSLEERTSHGVAARDGSMTSDALHQERVWNLKAENLVHLRAPAGKHLVELGPVRRS